MDYATLRAKEARESINYRYDAIKPITAKAISELEEENSKYEYRDMTEDEKMEAYKKAEITMPYDRHSSFEDWCYIKTRSKYGLKIRVGERND